MMSAVTGPNSVEVQERGGTRRSQLVDPTSTYQAVRIKHDFDGGRAHLGFLGTVVTRAERTARYPTFAPLGSATLSALCPGGQELPPGSRCTHDAYVGSLDGLWRSDNGEILLSAQAIASVLKHGPPRKLRDGTQIADGDAGYGAQLIATREGGSGLAWNAQYQHASRKLDFNDLGFMERQNQHFYYGNLEYRTFEPIGPTLETKTWVEVAGRHNLDLIKVSRRWLVDSYLRYKNFWSSYIEFNYDEPKLDDREIGNGTLFERPGRPGFVLNGGSDRRRDVFVEGSLSAQKLPEGTNLEGHVRALVRAHPQVEIELTPSASHSTGETRFASYGARDNESIFGTLRASSFATTARVNVTLTPRLALQTFGQVFLASGHYDDYRAIVATGTGPGAEPIRLASLSPSARPEKNPDFIDVSMNINVVLRWEYSLGSILYLVYNRAQTPVSPLAGGGFDTTAALTFVPLGRAPAVDTLLVKWQLFTNL